MELDKDAIKEFQELYFREYGISLSDQEAIEYGARLINFVKAVYGSNMPLSKIIDTTV